MTKEEFKKSIEGKKTFSVEDVMAAFDAGEDCYRSGLQNVFEFLQKMAESTEAGCGEAAFSVSKGWKWCLSVQRNEENEEKEE